MKLTKKESQKLLTATLANFKTSKNENMKQILLVIGVLICMQITYAQSVPGVDTLSYLKTVVAKKGNYIGKPFSVLMNDLRIQIRAFSPHTPLHSAKNKEVYTQFHFIIPKYAEDFKFPSLMIYWEPSLNAEISSKIYDQSEEGGLWIPDAIQFYRNAIIKNIDAY